MAIFPGGKSTRVNSPRHLAIRHSRRVVANARRQARREAGISPRDADDGEEIDPLPPGQQKLNSFWAPGLEAGPMHRINVEQTMDAGSKGSLKLEAEQDFHVDAPQFSLPEGSVHSTYPPAGYSDDHRILPHVVLTDPHLPWERLGTVKEGTNKELRMQMKMVAQGKSDAKAPRNRVPWLVMLSFSQDELRLPPDDLVRIFQNTSSGVIKPVKQSSTMTINTSIADLWKLTSDVVTPVNSSVVPDSSKDSRGDFVLVQSDMFTSLFSTFDARGNRVTGSGPSTAQYKYLAHVRKINGSGMALAGVEDTAVFSIVVGNRCGPLDNVTPTTMCAHLVSIEGVEAIKFPTQSQRYVALCSLYSWNYTVLPPNTLNVPDAFEHLGRTLDVLRAPDAMIDPLRKSGDNVKKMIARRLDDGFTLVKYRLQTGEATVALYRGPLTPTYVPPLANLNNCSNSGVDLQILDKQLGIMDVTYSVAWQVGRTMALGDEAFVAALGRIRTAIHGAAAKTTKLQTVKELDNLALRTKQELLEDIGSMVKNLAAIHTDPAGRRRGEAPVFSPGGARRRWFRSRLRRSQQPKLSFTAPAIQAKYPAEALKAARTLAGSRPGSGGKVYDETNDPQSTDWQMLLSWLLDRMFLVGVPAHCLVADPTYLQPENLRFFRIDSNWIDALIDGALSLGNHWGEDLDRVAIKQAFNDDLNSTPEGQTHKVQVPAYGFYLRSDLVTMFPDLRVEVLANDDAMRQAGADSPTGAPLLRHEIVTDGVMMAFVDRLPGSAEFASLVFTQPSHQQRFAVARGIDTTRIQVDVRRQYTVEQVIREKDQSRHDRLEPPIVTTPSDSDNIFIWSSQPNKDLNDLRILRLPRFADRQLKMLQDGMGSYTDGGTQKPYFVDDAATSALFAMQLNDPIYNLTIDLQAHPPETLSGRLADLGGGDSGAAKSHPIEVRTLRQLGTSQAKRLKTSDDDEDKRGTDMADAEADQDVETVTFQRRKGYTPSSTELSLNLAPHVRALTHYTQPPRDPDMSIGYSGVPYISRGLKAGDTDIQPAMAPRYLIRIGSNIVGNRDVITIDRNKLPQDLIMSVVLEQSEVSQYLLMELAIEMELGPPPQTSNDPRRFLFQNYTGPGAHMLTNLRFNVLPTITNDPNNPTRRLLRLRVLPRSAKGWIQATDVREMGFLLSLAQVNMPVKTSDEVSVQSYANYCRNPDQPLSTLNTMVITNPNIVVKLQKR